MNTKYLMIMGLACVIQGTHANNRIQLPQVGEESPAMTISPSALDKITLVNDFSPKQSENLETAKDWYSSEQIVLVSRPNGKYEYKFRFTKFHRQHKKFYIAKHTPYVVSFGLCGNHMLGHEHYGVTDENGYTQSVVLDFALKSGYEWECGDVKVYIEEFVDFDNGYGSNVPQDKLKDSGVKRLPELQKPYKNGGVPVVLAYQCPNKPEQYSFTLTNAWGDTHAMNVAPECRIQPFYVFHRIYEQDEKKHKYKK